MGKLTSEVFNESCCDGGAMINNMSAQPCGCDPGCNGGYLCERHRQDEKANAGVTTALPGEGSSRPAQNSTSALCVGIGGAPTRATSLPVDALKRKQHPVASGVLDYFPDAIVALAHVSWAGNEQHNPGQPLHWARGKSTDEADTMMRHFLQRGSLDSDGLRHTAKMAWRALALLQKEIENESV